MSSNNSFLPSLVLMKDHHNDWNEYLEAVYQHFCQDFVTSKRYFEGKRFALKRYPMIKDKEANFWHLITEGPVENEHMPDLRRCERIRWPRATIMASNSELTKCWRNSRRGEERVIIALEDFSYVVVLADRDNYVLLWTAYCVEQEHRRRKLSQEYNEYIARKG